MGLLVAGALAVAAVLVVAFGGFGKLGASESPGRPDKLGKTVYGKALLRAKDTDCQVQLVQLRQQVEAMRDPVEETVPADLRQVNSSEKATHCPIGGEAYLYDPSDGSVRCPHPGHEAF